MVEIRTAFTADSPRCKEDSDVVASLIESGLDVNTVNSFGRTPLHYAVDNGNPDVLTVLLEAGSDPIARCDLNERPLDRAEAEDKPENAEPLGAAGGRRSHDIP